MADNKYTIVDIDPAIAPQEYRKVKLVDQGDGTYRIAVDANVSVGAVTATDTPANNVYGTVASIAPAATATIASVPAAVATYRIRGILATATGNARVRVDVNGTTVIVGRIHSSSRVLFIPLPNGIDVGTGDTIDLKVTSESPVTISAEGTLLGEG
jgi:hypothetical protein